MGERVETWSPVTDSELPNPGSGAEIIGLRNGHWVLISNDTERGRNSTMALPASRSPCRATITSALGDFRKRRRLGRDSRSVANT